MTAPEVDLQRVTQWADRPALVAAVTAVLEICEKAENRPFRGIDFSGKPFPVQVDSGELRAAVAAALGVQPQGGT